MDKFYKNIKTIKVWAAAISLIISNLMTAQSLQPVSPIRFLALGDSYTIGESVSVNERWPNQLSDSLMLRGYITDTLTIIATTGWRTDDLISAITNKNLESKNYNLVALLIGVNNQYQGKPFSQYTTEFPALLDSAIRYAGGDKSKVFVVSIPDYAYTPYGQQSTNPSQISMEIDQYNAYNKYVADSLSIQYFDITPISRLGLQQPSLVAGDGLHPSGLQYTEWVKLMLTKISSLSTSVKTNERKLAVQVSPNPAKDHLKIKIENVSEQGKRKIEVYSITGKSYLHETFIGGTFDLDTQHLPAGAYFIKVTSGKMESVKKFIKY